ncbi:MAG: ATP-binding cassette domain-containing protein [Planctomycetes bacterium]|nr:ATP-binding cassette domain-containing protein [Planctomycetota bacterium]
MSAAATSAHGEVVIRYEKVCKRFGPKVVLQDLDLSVRRGETLAIMGPSGIGKSVTLRHAVGLLHPDSGRVLVEGHDMRTIEPVDLIALRKRMGYLFQDGALINWLSVGENVALPLRENTALPDDEIRAKVEHSLALVQMVNSYHLRPPELSGGMRKRVGLARALVTEPDIVFYDEPNTGLDPEISMSVNHLIRDLAERLKITSIVVTHLVSCVLFAADRVVLIDQGRVFAEGTPEEFLKDPNERVQRFLAKPYD